MAIDKQKLDEARAQLADALSQVPSQPPVSMNDLLKMRVALEACAKCFDEISAGLP